MAEQQTAGKALRLMFIGTLLGMVGALIPLLGVLLILAGGAMNIYGLYTAMPTQELYKKAMVMAVVSVVVSLLEGIFSKGVLHGLATILSALVGLLMVYYICTATSLLLSAKGDQAQADKAQIIITLNFVCAVVEVVCVLVGWIPILNVLAAIAGALTVIVALVAAILQVVFYYKSSQSLLA